MSRRAENFFPFADFTISRVLEGSGRKAHTDGDAGLGAGAAHEHRPLAFRARAVATRAGGQVIKFALYVFR